MTGYRLVSTPGADLDLEAAFEWYENERSGLGLEFLDELRATYDRHPPGDLLHVDDYLEKIPRLLAAAPVDTTTVNFGGSEATSIEEWCGHLQELTGLVPTFQESTEAFGSLCLDVERMHALIGPTRVDWRDGILRMVRHLAADALRPEYRG